MAWMSLEEVTILLQFKLWAWLRGGGLSSISPGIRVTLGDVMIGETGSNLSGEDKDHDGCLGFQVGLLRSWGTRL